MPHRVAFMGSRGHAEGLATAFVSSRRASSVPKKRALRGLRSVRSPPDRLCQHPSFRGSRAELHYSSLQCFDRTSKHVSPDVD